MMTRKQINILLDLINQEQQALDELGESTEALDVLEIELQYNTMTPQRAALLAVAGFPTTSARYIEDYQIIFTDDDGNKANIELDEGQWIKYIWADDTKEWVCRKALRAATKKELNIFLT